MTAGEFLEEYIESLENLPSEVQQGLQELGKADAQYFELRENYRAHWKKYIKSAKRSSIPVGEDPALVAARLNIEKEYCAAIRKVDQKIDHSSKLYELINRQIVRLDEETQRLGIDLQDPGEVKKDRKSQKGPISAPRSSPNSRKRGSGAIATMDNIDPNEPLYCFCQQVSFGDMVGCDNDSVSTQL
ncbi:Inhibitor of growth protein 5 [Entomortierella chlamydospora]|uniref:Inhibitor of growth protein 5 n=1 Tax=Entomortierella chlamydospora TaxID=101097 RepID=A0A9P6N2J1_9FUNG|nr:Inhibitor of growth protein 5 [Entomortierella chlamydospora]